MIKSKFKPIKLPYHLPYNFLAERMVLSCLLINKEAVEISIKILEIKMFYFKNHQEIFKAILFLYKNEIAIDIIMLTSFLQDNGLLKNSGGIKVLMDLINKVPNFVYFNDYIELVREKFTRRLIIKLGLKAINSGYVTSLNVDTILNRFESELFLITKTLKPNLISSTSELTPFIFQQLKKNIVEPNSLAFASGFPALDSLIQGFQKSDLVIIAGRPSLGKTALGLTVSLNVIKRFKMPILFFSLEMSKEQIMYRLLSMETNISQSKLRHGNLSKLDWIKISKVLKILSRLPFFIDDNANLNIYEIRTKLKSMLMKRKKIGLIIIDYLQLINNSMVNHNRYQEITEITRTLKNTAREFDISIIALSQLSRNVESRSDRRPILSDLRESGSIEQDADLVIMLAKNYSLSCVSQKKNQAIIDLIIAKQRNGPVGTVQLNFDYKCGKFLNC